MTKRIVILGAGESGAGAAVLAQKQGFDTFVSDMSAIKDKYKAMLDERGIAWEEGKHTEELILNADEVIKSPGIPCEAPMIQKLMAQGTPIISEIEFAGRYTNAKMICITGSNGKTSVKNILLEYQDSSVETSYLVKNIALSNSSRISTIEFELESKLSLLLKNNGTKITTNVDVNAIVPSNLENSSLFIEVSDLTNGTLKMNKLNFLTTYQNNKIDARLIQSVFPLAIGAFYDLNQNQVKASVFAKDLKPAQLISTPTNKKMMNNLKDLRLNLDLDFIFDVTQKKLALDSNGNLFVPEKLVPGSVTVDFDLDGDENKLNLNYLNVSGPQYNGSVDFSDMEHLALKILVTRKDGECIPTDVAKGYAEYFAEIMIDEYQDSNLVQELLLQVISGEDDGNYNRFMVGDIKQSIYGFREAMPKISIHHSQMPNISGCGRR